MYAGSMESNPRCEGGGGQAEVRGRAVVERATQRFGGRLQVDGIAESSSDGPATWTEHATRRAG